MLRGRRVAAPIHPAPDEEIGEPRPEAGGGGRGLCRAVRDAVERLSGQQSARSAL